jgi:glutathione peroxidase
MLRIYPLAAVAAVTVVATFVLIVRAADVKDEKKPVPAALNFTMKSLAGDDVNLAQYQGKVILMVNTASKCGFTPQYKGLQDMYEKNKDKGFVILGFPANNFGKQEPGSDKEIAEFCKDNYGVTFPMFSKISVLEPDKAPLYKYLTANAPTTGEVKWNFEKFLINRDGKIVGRFLSKVEPMLEKTKDDALIKAVEAELAK